MRTIIVGGGIAGLRIAKKLDAMLITDRKEFVFIPLLPDSINGEDPTRPITHDNTIFTRATRIDPEKRIVHTEDEDFEYDTLVLATGAQALTSVPGIKTYAHTFHSKDDADTIKDKLPAKRIVVVGAGPTGIELSCELARHGKVTLLNNSESIIPMFSEHAIRYTKKRLEREGIDLEPNQKVERITSRHVVAEKKFPYDLCIWTAGVKANLIPGIPAEHGYLVDDHLRVKGYDNIFAAGDCAQSGSPLTAQAAIQEADAVVHNIKRRPKAFKYNPMGLMIQLGDRAHIRAGPINITGRLAGWIRSMYYRAVLRSY